MEPISPAQQIIPSQPVQEFVISSPKQRGFLLPIIAVVLFVLIVGAGAYYFGKQSGSQSVPVNQTTQSSSPTQANTAGFIKRQFDVDKKFFQTQDYPQEIINVPEANLVGMKCTARLTCESPYELCYAESPDPSKPPTQVTDQGLLSLIKEANKTIDQQTTMGTPMKNVEEVTACETEDGRQILRYKTAGAGGGAGSLDYIGLVNPDNTVKKIASIQEGTAYFGCTKPLQLTRDNLLYYQCVSEAGSSIYKIDLVNQTSKPIIQSKFESTQ